MDPDVPANDHGNLTTMKRQLDATSRNLKALVQKDNILPSILPPVARNVIVSKTLPLILKMGLVLKNIQEGHVLKEGYVTFCTKTVNDGNIFEIVIFIIFI